MKILFTGGGSGGHFYPIIAVAESLRKISDEKHLLPPKMYFMAPDPYDGKALFNNNISFVKIPAGKIRRYFSFLNFWDALKTVWGLVAAIFKMYFIYPDVVFSKGGYGSFPAIFAARILGIPLVIHESDSSPGKANLWGGKFAKRIAVSFEDAGTYFPKDKVALTGIPVRQGIAMKTTSGAEEFLKLQKGIPVILILGGSQGAKIINDVVLQTLPNLLKNYQVIHQTGEKNFEEVRKMIPVLLKSESETARYKPFPYLNDLAMKMSAGAANLVVSRAGSTIFEIANWGLPSLIVPIADSNGDHQRKNAFAYAKAGACVVIEEKNLGPNVFVSEIDKLMNDPAKRGAMSKNALNFSKPDAADKIARGIIETALEHEN